MRMTGLTAFEPPLGALCLTVMLAVGMTGCGDDAASPGPNTAVDGSDGAGSPAAEAAAPSSGTSEDLARGYLAGSALENQYARLSEPVWKARQALEIVLADDPSAAFEAFVEAVKGRYTGFGSTVKQAEAVADVAVVAHYAGHGEAEQAAMDGLDDLSAAAFDEAETQGLQAVRLVTLARMARKPGSSRVEAFETRFQALLSGQETAPPVVLKALFDDVHDRGGAQALTRIVIHAQGAPNAREFHGPGMRRLAFWRDWDGLADVVDAYDDYRVGHWTALARWAVEAEFDGDTAAADRLAARAVERHRAIGRSDEEVRIDREAVAWLRANLAVSDPARAKEMYNDHPGIETNRREPGMSSLRALKRDVIAAAMMRAGFADRGYQLLQGGRGLFNLPPVVYSAMADAGMWEQVTYFHPRRSLPLQLLGGGNGNMQETGWPELVVRMSRQAREAGQPETADLILVSAMGIGEHPGKRVVAQEVMRALGADGALRAAVVGHGDAMGGFDHEDAYRMGNLLVREGMDPEQVMLGLGPRLTADRTFDRETLHRFPEFGTALGYGVMGMPKLW